MADAAVEFLLNNLGQLLLYHGKLIAGASEHVVKLEGDLRLLQAFLRGTVRKRREDEKLSEMIKQIRDVVYEAEDIVDTFVTQAAQVKSRNYFIRRWKEPVNLHGIAQQVSKLSSNVRSIYGEKGKLDFALLNIEDGAPDQLLQAPIVRVKNIVGFEDVAEEMIGYLKQEKSELDVISIIGMPGLGKTTIVSKIFHDPQILYEFSTRIWVYVSQKFSRKNVLLTILKELTNVTDDMKTQNDQELAKIVATHLTTGKFLLVLDDVWKANDLKEIKEVLPMSNCMGKILITSRNMEVGNFANRNRKPHKLRFLTEKESWKLLQQEVFGNGECPKELEVYGRLIVDECKGLPLAIVVIGGILSKKVSAIEDVSLVVSTWETVSANVNNHMVDDPDSTKLMEKVIALSYDALPYHLRECFLYLGMFPEDSAIPAWKLTCMWIAEGFIQRKENMSLEEVAETYLEDLINANLLSVDKRRRDGKVKTCRIHDVLRDFCRHEAGSKRENFLQEIKWSGGNSFDPPIEGIKNFRRVCIHSNATSFASSELYGPIVRSFVYFSEDETNLSPENISSIPAAFKLLRVLEAKPIRFPKLPIEMSQLVHLRYLTISFSLRVLPQAFSKLWNIQTLIVDTKERTLEIKADIWKMKQLRHFKTNASATLPKPEKGSTGMGSENIITLGTISPESCTEAVFERAGKVKRLGIRGRLSTLISSRDASFNNLGKLTTVEKLKLINDVFPGATSENPLPRLPPPFQFPPNMKSLTLADTFLKWDQMSILGQLQYLKVLKLNDKAFMGKTWTAVDGGFRKLEVLYIGSTNLVIWEASFHHFPRLRSLELKKCEDLKEIPVELAEIPTFKILELYRTNKSAAISAKKIREIRSAKMQEGKTTAKSSEFKLSIFPPEE